jgi:hypothetical protein
MNHSRRGFLARAVALIGAAPLAARAARAALGTARPTPAVAAPAAAAAGAAIVSGDAVVGFHADRPYWDASGTALPYRPPHGACSGAGLAPAAGADFIGQFGYC